MAILELPYIISGILSTIVSTIALIVGIFIISKYFKNKRKELIYMGFAAIFLSQPWWPSTLGFLSLSITGDSLSVTTYFFIGVAFIPFLLLSWLLTVSNLLFEERKKQIISIVMLISVFFEVMFLALVFLSPNTLGTISGYFDPNFGIFVRTYQVFSYLVFGITAILFIRELLKSDNHESKLRGGFLIFGFFTFLIGSLLDIYALIDFPGGLSVFIVIISRITIVMSEIFLYIGLTMPVFVKNIFIKE